MLVCTAVAYVLFRIGWGGPVTLVFLFLFAAQNFQALMAVWRTKPEGPAPPQLIEAETLFRAGELARARGLASALLDGELAAATRSRTHHLLGWIAVKEGEGRRALDEFSEVQGRPVEPQALAAAFSLVGDDTRAIPLWEQAAGQTADPTILHEWAGALLRHGDVQAAAALPGVDLATAYERAERVAFLRGAYSEAARFGEESLARRPSAARGVRRRLRLRPGRRHPPGDGAPRPGSRPRLLGPRRRHERPRPRPPGRRAGVPGLAGVPREICGVLTGP